MSVTVTLVRLAALELWTSFRLLAGSVALLASGGVALMVAGLEGPPGTGGSVARAPVMAWYGIALAVGIAIVAALVAGAFAGERHRGFAGWLVSRTAPRASLLIAWFITGGAMVIVGGAVSGIIGWLAIVSHGAAQPGQAATFAAALAGCLAAGVGGIAVALLLGVLVPPVVAAAAALLLVGAWLVGTSVAVPTDAYPGGAFATLAAFHLADRPIADGLRSAGVTLAAAAALLVVALAAFARVDL